MPRPTVRTREDILARVTISAAGCWLWNGRLDRVGYARVKVDGRNIYVHRLSYVLAYGEPEDGLHLDHLCRNKPCCNPEHLEAVTQRVNTLRADGPSAINARRTTCVSGHPFDLLNTRIDSRGTRVCIACARVRSNRWYERHAASLRAS